MSRHICALFCILAMVFPHTSFAVDTGGSSAPAANVDPDFAAGRQAVEKKDWARAIESLQKAAAKDARNADTHNLLGYSYRNSGQMELAFKHYEQALNIDPRHRGAHEYVGEAYLQVKNLAKAEEHLAALDRLCTFTCEELRDLRRKVAAFKKAAANAK
jgi:Flp pilus assembly protein TadD